MRLLASFVALLVLTGCVAVQTGKAPAVRDNMQLFLLIGQSNMAGRGAVEPPDQVVHPRVFMLNKRYDWVPAADPMHNDKPALVGVGLGSTFGREVADAKPGVVVGLIPAAFGGSSLAEWKKDGPLYNNALDRAREAMKQGKLAGILWHQGESDAAPELAATYPGRFAAMIAQLREDLGAENVPVVVGEIGRFVVGGEAINAALAQVPDRVPHCALVRTDGLTDKGDQLHFDTASFRELGRRYAAAWKGLAER